MKSLMTCFIASAFLLTACGKDSSSHSGGGGGAPAKTEKPDEAAPTNTGDDTKKDDTKTAAKKDIDPKTLIKGSSTKAVTTKPDAAIPVPTKKTPAPKKVTTAKKPVKKTLPVKLGSSKIISLENRPELNIPHETSQNQSSASETGARADAEHMYISLNNDGLMEKIKKQTQAGSFAEAQANVKLATQLRNGKMDYDCVTGQLNITVKMQEGAFINTYSFTTQPVMGQMVKMHSNWKGASEVHASVACVDSSGACQVAVLKLQTPWAKAYAVVRRQVADLKFRLADKNSSNGDLGEIQNFFENSQRIYNGNDQVDVAILESFEVAYGISMVRPIIYGRNGEILAQSSPLMKGAAGINWPMRPLEMASEDIDRDEINGRSTEMSSKMLAPTLIGAKGLGDNLVLYRMKSRSPRSRDEFTVKYQAHPVTITAVSLNIIP